jgi:hypothetical protein
VKVQLVMIVLSILLSVSPCIALDQDTHEIPIATQWTLDAAGQLGRNAMEHVYLLLGPEPPPEAVQVAIKKGTGFLLDNEHVVASCEVGCCRFQRHRVRCMNETGGGSVDQVLLCWSVQQTGACGNL